MRFENNDDDTVFGEAEMEISRSEKYEFKIWCYSDKIDVDVVLGSVADNTSNDVEPSETTETESGVENLVGAPDVWMNLLEQHYEDVKKQFEDVGFTNVTCVAHEIDFNEDQVFEGSVVNIAVGEDGEICIFEKGEQWPRDIKIRIDYRVKPVEKGPEENPKSETAPQTQSNGNNSTGNSNVTVPSQEESTGNLVWVPTNGGTKYHSKSSCSNMKDPIQVSPETAKSNGYTPCGRCY